MNQSEVYICSFSLEPPSHIPSQEQMLFTSKHILDKSLCAILSVPYIFFFFDGIIQGEFTKIPVSLGHKPAGELQLSRMAVVFMHPHHNQNRKIVIFWSATVNQRLNYLSIDIDFYRNNVLHFKKLIIHLNGFVQLVVLASFLNFATGAISFLTWNNIHF